MNGKSARGLRPKTSKVGLAPGSLVYTGINRMETKTETHTYGKNTWINVEGLTDVAQLQKIAEKFGLHKLVIEDILNVNQRPKVEEYGNYVYAVVHTLRMEGEEVRSDQVSFVIGKNFLLSFQDNDLSVFDGVAKRLEDGNEQLNKGGPDYLAYELLDAIIDNYFLVLEKIADQIEILEDEVVINTTPATLQKLHKLKIGMIDLRRSLWPLREVVSMLERLCSNNKVMKKETSIYYRDLYDHTIHVIDSLETFRDILSGMLDIYLSSVSNKLNEIMKVLTIISTIFIPLTFIVGIYGMNFKYMPELDSKIAYPIVLFVMVVIGLVMAYYFKRRKWF